MYARLAAEPAEPHWDLILIDVDHSPDEPLGRESDGFYRRAGLARARRHLAPGGVLGVWSYAESPRFADALARVFAEMSGRAGAVREPLVRRAEETNWLFFLGRGC